ncbi:hypothetical protein [Lactobacillus delbrueckii]|nr:hypothetical protein [Lactobacillus delbrueckii]MCD5459034.1 hypothetical protein [Lactobacillus delbrueckii subsp. bulgaricus]MCD9227184.1 hypothetical protein [Lactobacillus delbrueckii subsp. bulgaricus]
MKSLRGVEEDFTGDLAFDAGAQSELKLTIKQGQKGKLLLVADSEGKNCIKLRFKTGKHARLTVDRGECGHAGAELPAQHLGLVFAGQADQDDWGDHAQHHQSLLRGTGRGN